MNTHEPDDLATATEREAVKLLRSVPYLRAYVEQTAFARVADLDLSQERGCAYCLQLFNDRRKDALYCTDACKQAAYRERRAYATRPPPMRTSYLTCPACGHRHNRRLPCVEPPSRNE